MMNRTLNSKFLTVCLSCFLFINTSLVLAANSAGKIEFSRGQVSGKTGDAKALRLSRGNNLQAGQLISTGPGGIAIIRLADDSLITLRSNSQFRVDRQSDPEEDEPSMFMSLLKGGLRLVTGLIGKKNPEGYRLKTPMATIGIRGTEFNARICELDCATEDSQKINQPAKPVARPVGRIAIQTGPVTAISRDGKSRKLHIGGPIYEGDSIETGKKSHTVINFRDKSRISLNRDTLFTVDKHEYDSKKSDSGSALFSLFRGGLRALTGLIGKINPAGFRVKTPVATIGIRGTGFDLACQGSCISSGGNLGSAIDVGQADGLYASTWDGVIELKQGSATQLLKAGNTAFVANGLTAPIVVPQIPLIIEQLMAPRPDFVSTPDLFQSVSQDAINEGLYVNVDDGHVILENESGKALNLGAGESGYVLDATSSPVRLASVPAFQNLDNFPSPSGMNLSAPDLPGTLLDELSIGASLLGAVFLFGSDDDGDQELKEAKKTEPIIPVLGKESEVESIKKPKSKSDEYNRTGFYLGVAGGKSVSLTDEDELELTLGSLNGVSGEVDIDIIDKDSSGTTSRVYAGYRFNKVFSLELSQYDLGEVNIDINGTFTDLNLFADEAFNELPYYVRGTSLTANLLLPIGIFTERFTVFLKAGVMLWDGDIEATIDGQNFVRSVDGDSSMVGAGLALNLGDYLSLRFDLDQIYLDPEPLIVGTVGIMLQF
ncbi:MAG: hypothetical protein ACI8XC_003075 [Gammaproteobacteria bacterium]|jgi:hypothetical protein